MPQMRVAQVIKRNGALVPFDRAKITTAIYKAAASIGGHDRALSERLTDRVVELVDRQGGTPSVEEIQDLVEKVLIEQGHARTAKAYILYRDERARLRRETSRFNSMSAEPIRPARSTTATNSW